MATKPVAWMKIYTPSGDYVASCSDLAAAAVLMAFYGAGAEVRNGHSKKRAIWREGAEKQSAGESYDFMTATIIERTTGTNTPMQDDAHAAAAQRSLEQAKAGVRRVLASLSNPVEG